jgi:hypothetical protein
MQLTVNSHRIPLRRSRSRFLTALPTVRRPQQQQPPWRLIGATVVPLVVLGVVVYVARRQVFKGVAVFAKAIEEVADTVEDAAEDLAEAAQEAAEREAS